MNRFLRGDFIQVRKMAPCLSRTLRFMNGMSSLLETLCLCPIFTQALAPHLFARAEMKARLRQAIAWRLAMLSRFLVVWRQELT